MLDRLRPAVADAAGRVLATGARVLGAARPAAKPLHPRGEVCRGRVVRSGSAEPTGVPWLDEPGEDDVLVRLSRSVGLPQGWPDLYGLALRVPVEPSAYGDLLLATTGWRPVTRHLLVPRRSAERPMTTLLPYRTPTGPVVIGAEGGANGVWRLHWARPGQPWHPFGELTVEDSERDPVVSFDPVLNQLPALENYDWVARMREGAYAAARRSRR